MFLDNQTFLDISTILLHKLYLKLLLTFFMGMLVRVTEQILVKNYPSMNDDSTVLDAALYITC